MSDLYRSDNVVVRCRPAEDRSRWVVTFDNYDIGHGFDRLGFGEAFFEAAGISAIHVMGVREDWYQYAEMPEAMAAVREAVAGAERVMTYGSSMGAYAAIRFADAAGADTVLAFSPQYSIDPAKTPFEKRWSQDSARIAWRPEIDGPIRCAARPIVIYDPCLGDGRHADMIAADTPIHPIRLPHAGHPTTSLVAEMAMLSGLVLEVLAGTADLEAFARDARQGRRRSSTYFATLAERQPAWRVLTGVRLARRAVELNPHNLIAAMALGNVLARAGQFDEAIAVFEAAETTGGGADNMPAMHHYANALVLAGRAAEAVRPARRAVDLAPQTAHLHVWLASVLWKAGLHDEAIAAVDRGIELEPQRTAYRKLRSRYLRRRVTAALDLGVIAPGGWLERTHARLRAVFRKPSAPLPHRPVARP